MCKAQRDSPILVLYAASSIAGLHNDNLPHPYLRKHDCLTDPHQIWDEYSQMVNDEPYCFRFPIFLRVLE